MTLVTEKFYDVLIVGAGPAGSSAAIRLAMRGLNVALIEQKKFPRNKLCGEFISPECLTHFAELDVLNQMSFAGGVKLERTVFYTRNGRSVTVPSEWFDANSFAMGLSRAEMDFQLLKRAREAGVRVFEKTHAAGLIFDDQKITGVNLKNENHEAFDIYAPLTIDGTGRARILARQIETTKRKRANFVAFKTHLRGADVPDGDCEIYAYRGGYGGSSRIESGLHNFCFIVAANIAKEHNSDAARIMKKVIFENARAASSLGNAEIVEDWLAVPIENYGRFDLVPAPGLLTVGDAAAFIDPFTGSGILLALESAKIAASFVADAFSSRFSFAEIAAEYERQYSFAFDRRLRISSLVRRAAFIPFLAETVINVLSMSNRLTHSLARATRPTERTT